MMTAGVNAATACTRSTWPERSSCSAAFVAASWASSRIRGSMAATVARGEIARHYFADPRMCVRVVAGQDRGNAKRTRCSTRRAGPVQGRHSDQGVGWAEIVRPVQDVPDRIRVTHHQVRALGLSKAFCLRLRGSGCWCRVHAGSPFSHAAASARKSAGLSSEARSGMAAEEGNAQRAEHLPVAVVQEVRVVGPAAQHDAKDLKIPRFQGFEGQGGVVQRAECGPGDEHKRAPPRRAPSSASVPPSESNSTSRPPAPSTRTWSCDAGELADPARRARPAGGAVFRRRRPRRRAPVAPGGRRRFRLSRAGKPDDFGCVGVAGGGS